ncbi:hypothetical protein GPECTOR_808g37 [Gonium pectorale]|uniref:Uncharacterized protein n=1 Tax=Gonium pectorale TaxID=33097 RepID=A0A150FU05_GONPE|nr:hypothetical protein GPECTOR_808g37 [Gonium pectorale]|eukprot:KXZ41094.1 hypothetical protein GPECTOR_808g37 [Gonium pectorale]
MGPTRARGGTADSAAAAATTVRVQTSTSEPPGPPGPGDVANLVGPPKLRGPRWAVAAFDKSQPVLSRVSAVQVYLVALGSVEDPIANISMLVQARQGSVVPVTVFRAGSGRTLECPKLNVFGLDIGAAVRETGISLRTLQAARVQGVRIDVTDDPAAKTRDLPNVAAVGLLLSK